MQAIIYAFRSPGSGAVYIGKHECDPEGWPRRGNGRLPDGYPGRGVAVANFHAKHGDRVEWRILAVVPLADWPRAERRAVDLARAVFGRKCANIADGGLGLTSAVAQRLARKRWSDPGYRDAQCEAFRAAGSRPEVRANRAAAAKAAAQRPERKAQLARAAALNSTPEAIAKRQRTRRINDSWRRWAEANPHLLEDPTP